MNRTWLFHSPSREAAYCFCCLLFSESYLNARTSFEKQAGFTHWRKTSKVAVNEESASHRKSERRPNGGSVRRQGSMLPSSLTSVRNGNDGE